MIFGAHVATTARIQPPTSHSSGTCSGGRWTRALPHVRRLPDRDGAAGGAGHPVFRVEEAQWGSITKIRLPGGGAVGLFDLKQPTALTQVTP